jgi:hypothetical protein
VLLLAAETNFTSAECLADWAAVLLHSLSANVLHGSTDLGRARRGNVFASHSLFLSFSLFISLSFSLSLSLSFFLSLLSFSLSLSRLSLSQAAEMEWAACLKIEPGRCRRWQDTSSVSHNYFKI